MKQTILVTGAAGEVGTGLVEKLSKTDYTVVATDINKPEKQTLNEIDHFERVDVSSQSEIDKLFEKYQFDIIYHLAALLSTSAEKIPEKAHLVNTGGTFNLLSAANKQESKVKFIFPSTIAVYGMDNLVTKKKNKKVKENEFQNPVTMYGVNKLYCENLGIYYSKYYNLLDKFPNRNIDFRAVRFPGLLSAVTIPTGGTSDYAPEMIHAAARGVSYKCFVRPDSTIGFMAMPDAVDSLVQIANVDKNKLSRSAYNIAGFSTSAKDFENEVRKYFPQAKVSYKVDKKRQRIVDSWPMDTDDSGAVRDWEWKPNYGFKEAFKKYLVPTIKSKYN